MWDLAAARCRFGKYLRVEVNGSAPPVAEVLREFPARKLATEQGSLPQGLTVRLVLQRQAATGELDLGEAARFFPSDAALARWRASAPRRPRRRSSTNEARRSGPIGRDPGRSSARRGPGRHPHAAPRRRAAVQEHSA